MSASADGDMCREECVGPMVDGMRVPSKCDTHILDHMRCNCSACMNFACHWRDTVKNEFRRRVRDPLAPQRKPHRWVPAQWRCEIPEQARVTDRDPHVYTRLKSRSRRNRRSPRVSWWFGNTATLSDPEYDFVKSNAPNEKQEHRYKYSPTRSLKQAEPKCFDGFNDVAMDGTIGQSRLQDRDRQPHCGEPDCVTRCASDVITSPTRSLPQRRLRLAQGTMEDGARPDKPKIDELGNLNYCRLSARNAHRKFIDLTNESQASKSCRFHDSRRNVDASFNKHQDPKKTKADLSYKFNNNIFSQRKAHDFPSHPNHTLSNKTSNKYSCQEDIRRDEHCNKHPSLLGDDIKRNDRNKGSIYPNCKESGFVNRHCQQKYTDMTSSKLSSPVPNILKHPITKNSDEGKNYPWYKNTQSENCFSEFSSRSYPRFIGPQHFMGKHTNSNIKFNRCGYSNRSFDDDDDVHDGNYVAKENSHQHYYHRNRQHRPERGVGISFRNDFANGDAENKVRSSRGVGGRIRFSGDEERTNYHSHQEHTNYHSDEGHTNYHSDIERVNNFSDEEIRNYHNDVNHANLHYEERHSNFHNDEKHPTYYSDKRHSNMHSDKEYQSCNDDDVRRPLPLTGNIHHRLYKNNTLKNLCPNRPNSLRNKILLAPGQLQHQNECEHTESDSPNSFKKENKHDKPPLLNKLYKHWSTRSPDKCNVGICCPSCEKHNCNCLEFNENRKSKLVESSEALYPGQKHLVAEEQLRNDKHSLDESCNSGGDKDHQAKLVSPRKDFREWESNECSTKRHHHNSPFSSLDQGGLKTSRHRQKCRSSSRRRKSLANESSSSVKKMPDLNQSTLSRSSPPLGEAQHGGEPFPFGPSERAIRGGRPKSRPDWLQNHLSLMNDCSQERQKNAKSRMTRIVDKTNALARCSENIHVDFGCLHERLDKVKDMQQQYFDRMDEAIQRVKDRQLTS